jgi:hypothetical protein
MYRRFSHVVCGWFRSFAYRLQACTDVFLMLYVGGSGHLHTDYEQAQTFFSHVVCEYAQMFFSHVVCGCMKCLCEVFV